MIIGSHQVRISVDDRGDDGVYGKVYERSLYDSDSKWRHILTLAPGMKLTKDMFYTALDIANK